MQVLQDCMFLTTWCSAAVLLIILHQTPSVFLISHVISSIIQPFLVRPKTIVQFYNPGPKFWGSLPKKFLGAKNMQNLARFRSTSKFGDEYLQNGWRYSKSVSYCFDSDSSRVRRNKSGEVQSSDLGDLDVELNPPKAHFALPQISSYFFYCWRFVNRSAFFGMPVHQVSLLWTVSNHRCVEVGRTPHLG